MDDDNKKRIIDAWPYLTEAEKVKYAFEMTLVSAGIDTTYRVDDMKWGKWAFAVAALLWIAFILWLAPQYPYLAVAAALFLGGIIAGFWLFAILRRK